LAVSFKPVFATVLATLYLPVPPYLLLLHGLQPLWRRIGLVPSYAFLFTAYILMVTATILAHDVWSINAVDGWPAWASWLGVVPLAAAAALAAVTYSTIEPKTLHLARQLDPALGRTLITDGILGRMRHPRYTMFTLISIGNAIVTGYPVIAATAVITALLLVLTIHLEERELAAYFGDEFNEYRHRVPAFIPRFHR
jgi:protein-S-isoprenylcysteine O-methyltransferase Ste14